MYPKKFFVKINPPPWKEVATNVATSVIFKLAALSKLSPNRQKIAQSGHSVSAK
jgi:hypothetical protein